MPSPIVLIQTAISASMPELLTDDTYCWIDSALTSALGVQNGDQIRIQRTPTEYALYTIRNVADDTPTLEVDTPPHSLMSAIVLRKGKI